MPASILQLDRVTFGYGADLLFEDVSFSLMEGERIALVAPNGQGKSTLLKIVAGELQPDEGNVLIPKSVRVTYLLQSHEPDARGTVIDTLLATFDDARAARAELAAAEIAVASGRDEDMERLSRAQDRMHATGADTVERQAAAIASQVGFGAADLEREVATLSGGERGRLLLASALAARPDLLLLDEPTNHLDLTSVRWLEGHLRSLRAAMVVVSHDRAFLDAVCPRTAELGLFRFRLYACSYRQYVVERESEIERERAAVLAQREEIAKVEDFIRRNIAGQKTNQAKSRRKMLEKLVRLDNPEDIWADARKLGLRFAPSRRTGDIVFDAKGLSARRGTRTLFSDFDLLVRREDRIAIVGPNGSGKSTLLQLFADRRQPDDSGEVRVGSNVDLGYFDQHLESLDQSASCIDEIRSVRPDLVVDACRQYLSRFRFWGDDPFRAVASLSGGERTRLALAKLLLIPRNVLLLDEPTNHLDIPACEILEEALAHFEGTVILVSHDRYFLERVATRIVQIADGKAQVFNEGFRDYSARQSGLTSTSEAPSRKGGFSAAHKDKEAPRAGAPQHERKAQHQDARRQSKEVERRRRRVAELEDKIRDAEARLEELRTALHRAPGSDWEALARQAEEEQEWMRKVDQWTDECLKLMEQE